MTMTDETGLMLGDTTMPTPRNLARILKDQLNAGVLAERRRRGDVTQPEDTFAMQRSLMDVVDVCKEYEYAFRTAKREAEAVAEEELIEAVGEQDGHPNQALTVPNAGGDIRVSPVLVNGYEIDMDALMSAVEFATVEAWRGSLTGWLSCLTSDDPLEVAEGAAKRDDFLAGFLGAAMSTLLSLGKFEPQVSKVRVFAKELAREPGGDGVSATVTSAIRKTTDYRGVRIERKTTK